MAALGSGGCGMMRIRIIDRYLFWQLLAGVLLVLLTLTALDAFFSYINELDDVGRGEYGHLQALLFIFFSLPERMYQYAPTAILIGGLLSLGGLAARGELTALRAAGMSVTDIAIAVLKAGLVFVIAVFLLGEWLGPIAQQKGERLRAGSVSTNLAIQAGSSIWMKHAGRFVRSRGVAGDHHLLDVQVFEFDGSRLLSIVQATSARKNDNGWKLQNVRRVTFEEDVPKLASKESEQWPVLVDDDMFSVLQVQPEQMSLKNLREYIDYLRSNGLESSQYQLAYWNRFVHPLSSLVMLLLALPFVFGSQRSGGAGQKLFLGILLGVAYFLLSRLLNQLGVVYGASPFLSAILPLLLFFSAAVVMLRRV